MTGCTSWKSEVVFIKTKRLIDCCTSNYGNNGCTGGWMTAAYSYVKDNGGIKSEATYPYQAVQSQCRYNSESVATTCTGYVNIPQSEEGRLMDAVASTGPVAVAIEGVYYDQACQTNAQNHAVLVAGYGTGPCRGDYWLVKNSWGASWGINGYIKIARNRGNHCGIASVASYPTV